MQFEILKLRYAFRLALFAWLISRIFSANEQYFSLTTNQLSVLSAMAYEPNEQATHLRTDGTVQRQSLTKCRRKGKSRSIGEGSNQLEVTHSNVAVEPSSSGWIFSRLEWERGGFLCVVGVISSPSPIPLHQASSPRLQITHSSIRCLLWGTKLIPNETMHCELISQI